MTSMSPSRSAPHLRWARGSGLLLFVGLWLSSAWVSDDAFISFRSVEFVFDGLGPRWNLAERVQAYSHPLWFFLLVAVRGLSADLFSGVLVLSLAVSVATVALLLWRTQGWVTVVAVTALVCASKSFVEFSSSGLENPLCHLLVVLLFLLALGSGPTDPWRRGASLGGLLAALALCRIDLLVLAAPVAVSMLWRARSTPVFRGLLVGLVPLFAWEVWSLFYYGDFLPNTACAKVNHVLPLSVRFAHASDYFQSSLGFDYVTIPAILLASLAGLWRGGVHRQMSVGVLLYVAYVGWIPGDFMAGRMQSTPFVVAAAMLATSPPIRRSWVVAIAAVVLCASLANPRSPIRPDRLVSVEGVGDLADERAHSCCERSQKEVRPERWNGLKPQVVVGWGGSITYETGPSTHFVDRYALSDPLLSRVPVVSKPRARFRPGHLDRAVPDGYLESLETGTNLITDPAIAALWDDVRVATRAPLSDRRRWRAIAGTMMCGRAHRNAVLNR